MSSLRNLRSRFNKGEHEDKKDSKDGSKTALSSSPPVSATLEATFEVIESSEEPRHPVTDKDLKERDKLPRTREETASVGSLGGPSVEDMMSSVAWQSEDEKRVFEEQLTQLQEQLMMVMIENQALHSELGASKEKTELERVKAELAYERHRNEVLQRDLLNSSKKKISQKVQRSNSDLVSRPHLLNVPGAGTDTGHEDLPVSSDDNVEATDSDQVLPVPPAATRFYQVFWHRVLQSVTHFLEDFTEEAPEQTEAETDNPLTMKKLKENIKRFGTEATPYINTAKGMSDLLSWKSSPYTFLVFVVYMYSAWQGWLLPVLLFCLTFRFFVSYLQYRGWNISFNFFETVESSKDSDEKELGVSDKLNLVMNVAKKVQNFLGGVADSLEKIKSVLMWRHPVASRQLLFGLLSAFIISCVLPPTHLLYYGGLFAGVKLFLIDYVYNRFPRVRRKYDSMYRLWQELPTDIQYEKRFVKSEIDKYILPQGSLKGEAHFDAKSEQVSTDDRTFCELFSLPESECPLPGWHGGRRCTLINKEKSWAFKNGKLFLTHSFLCFERTKVPSPKNIVIPLTDIVRLEKAKPFGWIPGGGMAIEIAVLGNEKTFVFGGLLCRDELFDSICAEGLKKLKESSNDDATLPWMDDRKNARRKNSFVPKVYKPFSLASTYEDSD